MEQALRAADAAGDTAAASQLAQAIRSLPAERAFVGPVATGQEMAESRQLSQPKEPGAIESARILMSPTQRGGLGIGEAALSIGTGMVASPINSLWNAGMEALELPTGQPVGTYQPRSPEGQSLLSGADKAMRMTGVPQLLEKGMDLDNPDPAVRATGNLIGAGLGVMPAVGPMRATRARRAAIPTRSEIKTAANQAYERADQAGGMLPQSNLGGFVQRAEQVLVAEGFDKQLNPATFAAVQRFYDEATKPGIAGHSAQGAEVLRRVLLNAEKQAGPGTQDAMLAGKLVDEFDDFMDNQALPATPEYAQARALWQTQRKAQDIEALFERAKNQAGQFSVSGMENALRTQFKSLADNPRRFNRFNADEKEAILKVVRGGPVQNTLRLLGKLAPTGNLPIITALGAEGVIPGSGATLATVMGAGALGRVGASSLRKRSARQADELVRSGALRAMPGRLPVTPNGGFLPGYIPAGTLGTEEARRKLLADELRR